MQMSSGTLSLIRVAIVSVIALALFLLVVPTAWAATISISPGSGEYSSGQTFTVTFDVAPGGNEVNAVEASLSYDTSALEIVSVDQDNSAFSLWTTEPEFSNTAGTLTFGGGSPSPFTSNSTVLGVTFRGTGEGSGSVTFDDVSILAADGQGSDVFSSASDASYTIGAASEPEPAPEPAPAPDPAPQPEQPAPEAEDDDDALTFGDPPQMPEVGSQTFIDEDEWYSTTEGMFTWSLPFDVDAVAVEIATSSENEPQNNEDAIFDPPIEEFQITEDMLEDGVQYLSINFRNQVDWGTPLNRRIQIDTTPPEPFEIEVVPGTTASDFPLLQFEAVDDVSGIDYYELFIADREPIQVTPDEAEVGHLLGELTDGTYTVRIIAHDRAGNTRESSTPVVITAGWEPQVEDEDDGSFWDFLTAANIIIFILVLLLVFQGGYIWYAQKIAKQREEKLRRETKEIQDQMEKIFSALRDEIYDQINTITKRKRLSQSEREAVESLNQALEVSETLIEKEINDVKSILR